MMQQQTGSAAMSLATLLAMPGMAGGELPVTGLALDSRQVRPGDLFLAVPGLHGDGRRHIDAALAAGAAAVLCEAEGFDLPTASAVPVVAIVALRQRLGELADRFNHSPSTQLRVTGVTGTNGKSSVCHELAQLLGSQGDNCAVIGTLGNGFLGQLAPTRHTTPDVVQLHGLLARLLAQGADSVAMEVSSHALDQGRVDGVRFHEAVFTNLSHDHLDYHGDMQRYGAAKARLFVWPGLQRVVINLDDPFGRELLKRVPEGVEALSCSLERPEADLHAEIRSIAQGELRAWLTTPWGCGELVTTLLGRFSLANLLAALAVAAGRGFEFSALLAACRAVRPVEGRMERLGGAGRPTVVIDYAHTPAALQSVLEALREHCDGALWCLFGCGGDRDRDKRPLMGAIAVRLADRVMVTDDNPRSESPVAITDQILSGVGAAEVLVEHERSRAIEQVIGQAAAEDWILVAGKGHERYQEVAGQRHPCNDHAIVEAALQRYRVA